MKIGLVVSKPDKASVGVWGKLSELIRFKKVKANEYRSDYASVLVTSNDVIYADEVNDWVAGNGIELVIFLSRHEMRSPRPLITFHTPGNWTSSIEFGGRPSSVCISEPRVMSNLFREGYRRISELSGYDVALEATHHGPYVNAPVVFAEVGSSEAEWSDARAHEFLALLISDFLMNPGRYMDNRDVAVSIGDLHYSTLTRHVINGEYDLGHMVPKYIKPTPDIVKMAVDRNSVKPSLGIVHWKSLDPEDRALVEGELLKLGLRVIRRR